MRLFGFLGLSFSLLLTGQVPVQAQETFELVSRVVHEFRAETGKRGRFRCQVKYTGRELGGRLFLETAPVDCPAVKTQVRGADGSAIASVFTRGAKTQKYTCQYSAAQKRETCSDGTKYSYAFDQNFESRVELTTDYSSLAGVIFALMESVEVRFFADGTATREAITWKIEVETDGPGCETIEFEKEGEVRQMELKGGQKVWSAKPHTWEESQAREISCRVADANGEFPPIAKPTKRKSILDDDDDDDDDD